MSQLPTFIEEKKLWARGRFFVAGIDEAGRGALAGPVVASAVILPAGIDTPWLKLVRDSKLLTPSRRATLFETISKEALAISTGIVPHETIDSINILKATWEAMKTAVAGLPRIADFLLVDGTNIPGLPAPQLKIIDGDKSSFSIACASIVAKVTRDRIMVEMDRLHPGYGFAAHKGYGTAEHMSRLQELGPSPVHRLSFAPVKYAHRTDALTK